jgi:hypothetical protein
VSGTGDAHTKTLPDVPGRFVRDAAGVRNYTGQPLLEEDVVVADSEPVTAPDQLKPGHRRSGRIGAIVVAASLVLMMFCNNDVSGTEKLFLIGTAAILVLAVVLDSVLRRNGLRPKS